MYNKASDSKRDIQMAELMEALESANVRFPESSKEKLLEWLSGMTGNDFGFYREQLFFECENARASGGGVLCFGKRMVISMDSCLACGNIACRKYILDYK